MEMNPVMATVTNSDCKRRHVTLRWWSGGITMILFPVLMAAALSGYSAQHQLDTHSARQNGSLETIDVRLTNIEVSMDHNRELMEEILRKLPTQ